MGARLFGRLVRNKKTRAYPNGFLRSGGRRLQMCRSCCPALCGRTRTGSA